MKTLARLISTTAIVVVLTVSLFAQGEPATSASSASHHTLMKVEDLKWGDAPPALPRGAKLAVLQGDPMSGAFTIRLKVPAGYKIPLHTHPSDEMVTVISGSADFAVGGGVNSPAESLRAGGFALMPAGMQHSASATSDTILQVSSPAAFIITYVDPKDDPRQTK